MIHRLLLLTIFLATLLIGAAYATAYSPALAAGWGASLMVLGISLLFVALLALGAHSHVRPGPLWTVLGALFVIMVLSFGAALFLPAEGEQATSLWLGLPRRAAIVIYGVGLLPLLLLPIAYALTFPSSAPTAPEPGRAGEPTSAAAMTSPTAEPGAAAAGLQPANLEHPADRTTRVETK